MAKTYGVQGEGKPDKEAMLILKKGVTVKDGMTKPAKVRLLDQSPLPPRDPPIRVRKNVLDCWNELTITEGKNRQVRRMTAAVGHPTLRLFRASIGTWKTNDMAVGEWRLINVHLRR